ncbi:M15 family metallopeptidase [Kaistia soli]|nr:M15 family metallopeptidase [Kaistia soli]
MSKLSDLVPIPSNINQGLSPCRERTMLDTFGKPGELSRQCSPCTGDVRSRMQYGVSVGPFKVSGMDYAVASLMSIFADLKRSNREVYDEVHTAGMLCVRAKRPNPKSYSNHSWGTAIDLYFGNHVLDQGVPKTQLGFLYLFGLFNAAGWYWAAGYSGKSVDSMHFELADETIAKIPSHAIDHRDLIAAADYIAEMGYGSVAEVA